MSWIHCASGKHRELLIPDHLCTSVGLSSFAFYATEVSFNLKQVLYTWKINQSKHEVSFTIAWALSTKGCGFRGLACITSHVNRAKHANERIKQHNTMKLFLLKGAFQQYVSLWRLCGPVLAPTVLPVITLTFANTQSVARVVAYGKNMQIFTRFIGCEHWARDM